MGDIAILIQEMNDVIKDVASEVELLALELQLQCNHWYLEGLSPEYRLDTNLIALTKREIPAPTIVLSLN